MRDEDIGDIIIEKDGTLYDIVTDRHIVVRVIADGKDVTTTNLESVCSRELITVTADDSVKDATQLIEEHAVRLIPVLESANSSKIIGIISLGDISLQKKPKSSLGKISAASGNV